MEEQCLVLIKPDAMQKCLAGSVISDLYHLDLKLVGVKLMDVKKELAEEHYAEHKGKPFFEKLIKHIMGDLHGQAKVLAMVYQGPDAVKKLREFAGNTHPQKASPSTLRGKYGRVNTDNDCFENVVHVSDSPVSAEREIKLWFQPNELVSNIFPVKKIKKESENVIWK